jgi:PAS domain S-box-containing protein
MAAVNIVPKFQATARVILIGALATICGIIALTTWTIWDARRVAETHAIQSSENLVSALAHDIARNIEIYDLSLGTVIEGLNTPGIWGTSDRIRNEILFDGAGNAADLGAIFVLDENGNIILDSRAEPPRKANFSDRDYFQVQRDQKDAGLFISEPYQPRLIQQQWSIAFSRRLQRADGGFAGIVFGSLRLAYFKRLFEAVNLDPNTTITLFRTDGTVLMRLPYDETSIGRNLGQSNIFQQFPGQRAGHFVATSQIDGSERLFVYQQLGDLPLVLSVAPTTEMIFAEWREKTIFTAASMLGLLVLVTLLAIALYRQLRQTERADMRLVEAIESISEGFVIYDQDDRFVMCNEAYRQLYSENAALMVPGVRYEDIMRRALAIGRYPEAKGHEEEWLAEWMRKHNELDKAHESHLRNGRWVLTSERRMPSGGTAGLRIDITELKSVQASLRASQAMLNLAQRVSNTGSVFRDFRRDHAEWSDEMFRIMGVTREEFAPGQKKFLSLVHPEERDIVVSQLAATERGIKTPPLQFRIIRPSGDVRWVYRESDLIFDADGTPSARLSTYRDITEERAKALRQAELEEQLRHSQKLEALGTLAGGVAHDLNNTLVPVLALSKVASRRHATGSLERRELETILQAGEQARDLVKQILAFSRKEGLAKHPVDLAALVPETLKMLRASVPTTIQIIERVSNVPRVKANAGQLKQVVMNLVTNAAQAIGDKLGTITVTVVQMSAAQPGARENEAKPGACLTVTDTGSGIDEAHLHRIFEPFFTTKDVGQGTGLGLSVVHGIVVDHGGHIECKSKRGHGTEFTVFLPAITDKEASSEMQPAA